MRSYPGGFITATTPTVTSTSANGIWTLEEALQYKKAGTWPTYVSADTYFPYTVMLLQADATNGAQNNTFLDSSTNAFSITRNGNTTQGTFTPFSQTGWSNYFDGTGDYLAASSNAAFGMGSGDYTIECWLYLTANTTYHGIYSTTGTSSTDIQIQLSNRLLRLSSYTGEIVIANAGTEVPLNAWTHVAFCRSGSTVRLFKDGVQVGSGTDSTTWATGAINVGQVFGSLLLTGYMSNLRVVKGTAVYTSAFTPPTAPLTAITNTSLLTCQSNRFVDNSSNAFAITVNGNTSVQAFSPFSPSASYDAATVGGSGYFDGTGDYLATSTSQIIPTGSFTIEAWIYTTNANSTNKNIVSQGTSGDSGRTALSIEGSAWWFQVGNDYVNAGTPVLGQWNYVAMTFNGSTIQGYVNGVSQGSISHTGNAQNTTLSIGRDWNGASWNGYIASLRISNTVRTVTSVPTAPFSNDANTSFLCNFTNAGITDATAKNDLETVGNAQISNGQAKWGSTSMYFDGTGDYLNLPLGQNFNFGTGNFTIECWVYFNSVAAGVSICGNSNDGGNIADGVNIYCSASGTLRVYGPSVSGTATTSVSTGTWYHIAVTRSGNTFTLWKDGVSQGTFTDTGSITGVESTRPFTVGRMGAYASYVMNGYIDDFRVTKGVARYTAGFTPPTEAFAKQ